MTREMDTFKKSALSESPAKALLLSKREIQFGNVVENKKSSSLLIGGRTAFARLALPFVSHSQQML